MSQVDRSRIRVLVHKHWLLLAIIGLYLLLGVLYMWAIPPFEGPDEPQHVAYIRWLAEGKGFPPQGDVAWDTPIQQEAGQSPFYYLIASVPARAIDLESPEAKFRSNPYAFSIIGSRQLADNNNRAIHYATDARPLAGGWLALYSARAISLLFGILLLVSTYGLARQVAADDPKVAIAAALLVAVTPQVLFISSVASNDIPAAAFSALALWLLARMIRRGLSGGRALGVGVAYGMAILSKSSAAALGLAIAAALAWFFLSRRNSLWQTIRAGVWLILGTSLSAGWWLIRSWLLYGSPLGLTTHDLTPWAVTDPESLARFPMRWLEVFRSYWIALGWGTIRPDGEWLYITLLTLALAAMVGLTIAVVGAKERLGTRPAIRPILVVILLLAVVTVAISLEMWMRRVIAPYGRLMFPALAAITVLLTIGWYALDRRLPFVVGGTVLAVAVLSPFLLVKPAFELPEALLAEEVELLPSRLDVRFGSTPEEPVAILLSADAQARSVLAGENLPVKLCWRPVAQSEQAYAVLVHIVGPENSVVSSRRTFPGLGHFPTTHWEPDYVFCDLVYVSISKELPRTLVYRVEVAMLDHETGERMNVYGAGDEPLPGIFADSVRLVSLAEAPSLIAEEDGSTKIIELVDHEVDVAWRRGQVSELSLGWVTRVPLAEDYQVFVHLRDPASGEIVAQADGAPLGGWYPTSYWPINQIMLDERTFALADELAPGDYDLVVGFYDLSSLERVGNEYSLGVVEVEP
jgi:hypothetical protein